MPITYTIHADLKLLVTRYVGVVTNDEFTKAYYSILEGSEFQQGFYELVDLQEVKEWKITAGAMENVSALVSHFYKGSSESMRTAVLTPRDELYGIGRMYGAYADSESEDVKVFKDVIEAMRWLGLDPVSLAELYGA